MNNGMYGFPAGKQVSYLGVPIGGITQSPFNIADPRFLPCDGRRVNRSDYPALSALVGEVGYFTPTSRNRIAVPTNPAIAMASTADSANFCAVGGDAATQVYTSPDGITWTSRTSTGCSQAIGLLSDGATGMVALSTSAGSYSSNSGVNWSAASGTVACGAVGGLAYAPTVGANGRFLAVPNNVNTYYTSDDRGATWTTRSALLPGNPYYYTCWTGQRFLIIGTAPGNLVYASNDGVTSWTSIKTTSRLLYGRLVSNGNGKVAVVDISGSGLLYYSLDHGATWSYRAFGAMFPSTALEGTIPIAAAVTLSCANGRFFLSTGDATSSSWMDQNFWCSTDLLSWTPLDLVNPGSAGAYTQYTQFNYKAGVYLGCDNQAGTTMTLTEDTSKIQLPNGYQGNLGGTASINGHNNYLPFIRVR